MPFKICSCKTLILKQMVLKNWGQRKPLFTFTHAVENHPLVSAPFGYRLKYIWMDLMGCYDFWYTVTSPLKMNNNNFGELLIYCLTPSDQNSVLKQVDWHVHEMCLLFSLVQYQIPKGEQVKNLKFDSENSKTTALHISVRLLNLC